MTDTEAALWNSKYEAFYLSRFSRGRYITLRKPYRDIRDALKASFRADKRNPQHLTFIDVKP